MNNIPKVINLIVKNDLCIGCGLCVYKCTSNALQMNWNEFGFLIPELTDNCNSNGSCLSVCPFNPFPDKKVETENELASLFLTDKILHHPKIGKYKGIYAGYANEFRLTSSSGGIASFIFTELFEQGIVDHIISVKESVKSENDYEYAISNSKEELLEASKTKYYPVTLSDVLSKIYDLKGKVAISGVACFIKAIRLAQYNDPALKEKIPFLVGIICGGVKSRFFTEYLAEKAGTSSQDYQKPQYRIKNLESSAGDYSFGCYDVKTNQINTIRMKSVGDMWGTGLFKANACDFCDDATTELADISLGDAWILPYHLDGKGTNLFLTRTLLADKLIVDGIKKGKLNVDDLNVNDFLKSQKGSFNHRHIGLSTRIKSRKKKNLLTPPKRFENEKVSFDFKIVQLLRLKVRRKSLELWKEDPKAIIFERKLSFDLKVLKLATTFYHYKKALFNKLKIK